MLAKINVYDDANADKVLFLDLADLDLCQILPNIADDYWYLAGFRGNKYVDLCKKHDRFFASQYLDRAKP